MSTETILDQLGMKPREIMAGSAPSSPGTALALPGHIAAVKRVFADAISLASLVDSNRDRDKALERMRGRMVMNQTGDAPLILPVLFEGHQVSTTEGVGDIKISTTIKIPGKGEVEALPLITFGVNYLVRLDEQDGGGFASSQTFHCVVFRPKNENGPYKVLPLEILDPSVIGSWNRVAKAMPAKNWSVIDPIETDLRKPHTRTITLRPSFLKKKTFKNKKPFWKSGMCEEKLVDEDVWYIGYLFGQMLKLSPKSQMPPVDEVEGKKVFVRKHVFRVKISEGSLELTWLGLEGVIIDTRVPEIEVYDEMDSFQVLGVTPITVDIDSIRDEAYAWLKFKLTNDNPLFKAAKELGLVISTDSEPTIRANLSNLAKTAVEQVCNEMFTVFDEVTGRLAMSPDKPTMEQVLAGHSLKATLRRLNADDEAAKWIGERIEGDFDSSSPFHMEVRRWFIELLAKQSEKDPEPAKRSEEQKKEEVVLQEVPPVTPEEASKKKPSKRKK